MANEIGQILGQEPMVPNSPLMPVGQALTQNPTQQPQIPPEMAKDPRFHAIGEWIRRPENMLTALVLAGSLMQDRRPGQSKLDAIAERGLGTLGFRGEMRRLNQKDVDEAAKAKSEADYKKGQIDVATDRNRIERQGIEAASQDVLNRETAETGRAGMEDARERWRVELELANRLKEAQIMAAGGSKNPEDEAFLTSKDIIDIQKFAGENGIPFDQAITQFARVRAMTDPRFAGWLKFSEGPPTATTTPSLPGTKEPEKPVTQRRGRVGQSQLESITTRPGKREIGVAMEPKNLGEFEAAKAHFRNVAKRDRRALEEAGSNPNLTQSQRLALQLVLQETSQSKR